jgi:hypothetical protein
VKRAPDNVRNQGYFRRHMLTLSFTARDPKPTLREDRVSVPGRCGARPPEGPITPAIAA